jgi:hypothetical protein
MATSRLPIVYSPRPDATPETERSALAAVYKLCFESHAKKKAAGVSSTNGDDAKGSRHDRARHIIQDQP